MPRGRKPNDPTEARLKKPHRLSDAGGCLKIAPESPPWLNKLGKQEWDRIVPTMLAEGILYASHLSLLAAYCQAYGFWRTATDQVELEGLQVENAKGELVPHPLLRFEASKMSEMRRLSELFGLSLKSRSQVSLPPGAGSEGETDALDDFLEGET